MSNLEKTNPYDPGHPWYYLLGGSIPKPKQIVSHVKESRYEGYMLDDIQTINKKMEPQRSEALRKIKEEEIKNYKRDLSRYRNLAFALIRHRKEKPLIEQPAICDDIHTNISLKYNHLYNRFAHLILLDDLLSKQPDLFDF